MTFLRYTRLLLAIGVGLTVTPAVLAQAVNVTWIPTGVGNWSEDANWNGPTGNFQPEAGFDENAQIANGGTVQVIDTPKTPGGVLIDNGKVDVTTTGNLTAAASAASPPLVFGNINVGSNGTLNVAGTLSAEGNLTLGGSFVAELTSASYTPVSVAGQARLGGAFTANFNGAPTGIGNSWNIIDAATISGDFNSVNVMGANLPPGQGLVLQQASGGTNGNLLRLAFEQQLVLHFDRDTRIGSIQNVSGSPASLSLDGYWLRSELGSLDPAGWNSLEDQGTDGNTWFETGTGGSINQLAELNPTTLTTLAPGASLELGEIYTQNFADVEFGEDAEDQTFTYQTAGGRVIDGAVTYSGDKQFNNVVLTIDPNSGDATLQNESELSVMFDFFTIQSPAGALMTTYNSLQDQGVSGGNWLEGNLSANRVTELRRDDVTTLNTNQGYHLDSLYNTGLGVDEDLTFQFLPAGMSTLFDGEVVFGALPDNVLDPDGAGLLGDYNEDGVVNAADYTVWRNNVGTMNALPNDPIGGTVGDAQYQQWANNFGNTLGSGAGGSAVPEPSSLALLLLAMVAVDGRRRLRRLQM